ncbi:pentatricopeptide repeat-containing protein [Canna indica]|uniref:Pentatricopeptide repeat-containing protein n=1 Tax=Canna indica TaxID=4628 RepID=A0AAQ3KZ86_9LILI|nr:pentatricopeptide repeat-containing protein [Canna indica]
MLEESPKRVQRRGGGKNTTIHGTPLEPYGGRPRGGAGEAVRNPSPTDAGSRPCRRQWPAAEQLRRRQARSHVCRVPKYGSRKSNRCASKEVLLLYARMRRFPEIKPLTFTISSVLKGCSQLVAFEEGKQIHADAFKHGFQFDARVQTTLIDFYSKCKRLTEARQVFDGIARAGLDDVQACNTMIAGYAEAGDMVAACALFESMPERNTVSLVVMIGGYASQNQMDSAHKLFERGLADGEVDVVVCTAMITGYAKCGNILAARSIFDDMPERDVASWNAMISAYSQADLNDEALDLFRLMLSTTCWQKVEPNHATIATIVSVCANYGSPSLANWIQNYVDQSGRELLNSHTVAALIDLHSKCGNLNKACELFQNWKHKDLICYSSMIAGLGIHGRGKDAVELFERLTKSGLKPDSICFVSVLTACSHAGMVDEGRRYFRWMRDEYCIPPTADHYMCIVDLLGRAGCIDEAYRLIATDMPPSVRRYAPVWGALLSACRTYSNVTVGEAAARHLMELEAENTGNYVLLSNIYAKAKRWDGVARVRAVMRARGMRKPPGWSWVEVEGALMKFMTGEVCDERLERVLELLEWELRDQGFLSVTWEIE